MILDLNRPRRDLDKGSDRLDPHTKGADFIEQDGVVFGWSESNVCYERAWWLDDDVTESALVKNIRKSRPLPGKTHAEVIAALGSPKATTPEVPK